MQLVVIFLCKDLQAEEARYFNTTKSEGLKQICLNFISIDLAKLFIIRFSNRLALS